MTNDSKVIAEAYATSVGVLTPPIRPTAAKVDTTLPSKPVTTQQPAVQPPVVASQNNQEVAKKDTSSLKDWIRLPFIDTPFKARMAAVLIVELINTMSSNQELRDLVLKEIRTSNRLHRKK